MRALRWLAWACVGAVALASGAVRAEQSSSPPAEPSSLDKQISAALRDVHDHGAELYNSGDAAGCYRLLQGGLLAARAMLSQRPDLRQKIDEGLTSADSNESVRARAFALHGLIEEVRKQLRAGGKAEQPAGTQAGTQAPMPERKAPAEKPASGEKELAKAPPTKPTPEVKPAPTESPAVKPKAPTLWGRLGDRMNVVKIVNDFVALAANDPKVDFTRGGKYPMTDDAVIHLKRELIDFISQASGGPFPYTGKSMKEVHQGMAITNAQFDASIADLKKALVKNGVQPADVDQVLGAVEATRKDIVEDTGKR